jgi:hypothetical protein
MLQFPTHKQTLQSCGLPKSCENCAGMCYTVLAQGCPLQDIDKVRRATNLMGVLDLDNASIFRAKTYDF